MKSWLTQMSIAGADKSMGMDTDRGYYEKRAAQETARAAAAEHPVARAAHERLRDAYLERFGRDGERKNGDAR